MSDFERKTDGEVLTRDKTNTKEPPLFKVILLNDDYTTMEFVVLILESIFHKSAQESRRIMFAVHEEGAGVAGIYTKEIAETKIAAVHHLARQNEFPLKCSLEAE